MRKDSMERDITSSTEDSVSKDCILLRANSREPVPAEHTGTRGQKYTLLLEKGKAHHNWPIRTLLLL